MLTRPLGIFSLFSFPRLNVFVSSVQRYVQGRTLWQPSRKTFLVRESFICVRVKTHFHINGFALSLALKQRLGAKSVKYDKISCIWSTFTTTSAFNPWHQCLLSNAFSYHISIVVQIFPSDCSPRSYYGTNCFSSTEHLWISDRWKQS